MATEAAAKGVRDVHQLVNKHLCPLLFAEFIKLLGDDLNNVVGLYVKGMLHDLGQAVAAGYDALAGRTPAPDADDPGSVDVGHLELADDLLDLDADVLGRFISDHRETPCINLRNNAETSILITQLLDTFTAMMRSLVHARASRGCPLPLLRRVDIGTPEWPRSALAGTVGVYCAPDCCVKEDAVLVLFLDKTNCLPADDARKAFPKLCLRKIETLSQRCHLLTADEHRAGKSTAATPAPQARKTQTVFIPEIVHHEIMHLAA